MALKKFPTISIVVPCFNVEHIIERCIEALLAQDYPKEKMVIIIVDDCSTDDTLKKVQQYQSNDQIKIIKHFRNRGLSATRNSGINASKSQIIGFIDSDIVVRKDWVKIMMNVLQDPDVMACMGDTKLPESFPQANIDKFLYHPKRGVRKFDEDTPIAIPGFIMGNSFVKREALQKVGIFDESFNTWGGEDTDLAIRLWEKYPDGLRFSNKAIGEHFHKRKLNNLLNDMKKYGSTNYLILLERYPQYNERLSGDWIKSFKGFLILNPIVNLIVKTIYLIFPIPRLIRYFIAYNVIRGARNSEEVIPKLDHKK
ncbi:MAG: glycosyltransferase [Planctomycetia bacterium]|nr:glycosyltransferase [Planctomycetia bacterium]